MVQIAVRKTTGLGVLWWKLRVWSYLRLFHRIMLNRWEDGFIVQAMDCPPERLFRPDIAIVAWRRWCDQQARTAPGAGRGVPLKLLQLRGLVPRNRSATPWQPIGEIKLPEHDPALTPSIVPSSQRIENR